MFNKRFFLNTAILGVVIGLAALAAYQKADTVSFNELGVFAAEHKDIAVTEKSSYGTYLLAALLSGVAGTEPVSTGDIYEDWKAQFITSKGAGDGELRVYQPDSKDITVSEGQGYGMLLAVYQDDRETFDKLHAYAKRYYDGRGLMHWKINKYGEVIGRNAATDADEDIGFALLVATKKWGDEYHGDALRYINAIYKHEVEQDTYVLKPGDVWGGSHATNPSYFAPAYYREFAKFTGNDDWYKVLDKSYEILFLARDEKTGLLPDWTTSEGHSSSRVWWNKNRDNFSYNAVRVPWRIAIDWEWNKELRAYEITNKMTKFFADQSKLRSGYELDGSPTANYFNSTFAAGIAAGAAASDDTEFAREMEQRLVSMSTGGYYGASLRALTLYLLNGVFAQPSGIVVEDTLAAVGALPDPEEEESTPQTDEPQTGSLIGAREGEQGIVLLDPPVATPQSSIDGTITVRSPRDGQKISGEKKLKIHMEDIDLDMYTATYNVDSRGEEEMHNAGGKYKQAKVEFDYWDWNGTGPYKIIFTTRDHAGKVIDTAPLTLYVKH